MSCPSCLPEHGVPATTSLIVTCTEFGLPAVTDDGGREPRDTVKVSSSPSVSWVVVIVPVPVVWPELMLIEASVPTSPDSAVFEPDVETVTGMVTLLESALDRLTVTMTGDPSVTGFGDTESETVGAACCACRVMVTV